MLLLFSPHPYCGFIVNKRGNNRHHVIPEKNRHLSEFTLFLVQEMEFRLLLLEVGKALSTDNVKALAFLCTDILNRNTESLKTANDLFLRLEQQDHLLDERRYLLTELLCTIQRLDLVRQFNLNDGEPRPTSLISSYRWAAHILLLLSKSLSIIMVTGNYLETLTLNRDTPSTYHTYKA